MSLPPEVSRVWSCIVGHGEVCLICVCGGGIRKQLYVLCSVHMIMMIIMIIMMMIMMMSIHSRF